MRTLFTKFVAALAVSFALFAFSTPASAQAPYDVVVAGGRIVDGTGNPWYRGDVGIRNGRIDAIGDLGKAQAARRIDATGMVVAPGFIDIHTHADEGIEKFPAARNYLQQGVTTVVGGNCGGSIYPVGEKLAALEKTGLGLNFALLVGQGTIREQVLGMEGRPPTADELARMEGLVARAMEQGAVGLSTGLYYAPGSYSSTEEVVALSKVAARYGGIYTSHIRDESDYTVGLVAAVKEAIEIGEKAGLPVQVSHLKALGKPAWGKSAEILGLIDAARARGVDVAFDQYPYAASGVGLIGAAIPRWAQEGGDAKMKERLSDPASRERVLKEMASSIDKRGGPEKQFIAVCAGDSSLEGEKPGRDRQDQEQGSHGGIPRSAPGRPRHPRLVQHARRRPDPHHAVAHGDRRIGRQHCGVRQGRAPSAILRHLPPGAGQVRPGGKGPVTGGGRQKMSSAPAARIGLTDRGLLKAGMAADVTLFNPSTVADTATFQNPHQYPAGIEAVIVNGQIAILGGEYLETRAGRVLYRNHASFRAPAHAQ